METENQDSINAEDELIDDSQTIDTEEGEPSQEDIAKLVETNKKLFARAKKAEQELKAHKESSKTDKPVVESQPEKPEDQKAIDNLLEIVDFRVKEKLEDREYETLDISDAAKKDLRAYAKAGGLSVAQVIKSDYFKFLKQKEEEASTSEKASIGGKRAAPSKKDFSEINPAKDFDLSTKEGQEKYEEWKAWLKTQ